MIKGLSAEPRSKKRSGEEAFEILFLAASPFVTPLQSTLTRPVQRLSCQISLA